MKKLKFIHITKSAGTSIENSAKAKNIEWGRFDLYYQSIAKHGEWWYKVITKNSNYDWFMVARNPYDRLLSEFHYESIENCDKKMFNDFIKEKIMNLDLNKHYGYYIPQYLHLQDDVKIHVLKFENIHKEFETLMEEYNLTIKLDNINNYIDKKFGIMDFDSESIKLINKVYNKDFKIFGYTKIYTGYNSIILNKRQLCDYELIVNGGFNPLKGFMDSKDYIMCLNNMKIKDGFFPLPITLCIDNDKKNELENEEYVILKYETGLNLGVMEIANIYLSNIDLECEKIYGCHDINHPYIQVLEQYKKNGLNYNIGGSILQLNEVPHHDFQDLRLSPREMREFFKINNWSSVIGFQTRNPMHKSHFELTKYALSQVENSKLLLHPVVGITQECDVNYYTRVKCYKKIIKYYTNDTVKLSLLPLSMRMAGPKEALLHALIRKNYGCTHFIIGRGHAEPSVKKIDGSNFFEPYEAQELFQKYSNEIGIIPIISKEIVYADGKYLTIDKTDKTQIMNISGTKFREMLISNTEIPEWYSFPDIITELKENRSTGLCLYLIGLSGSGKSTLANYIMSKIHELTNKKVTVLDGDIVRTNLSKGLGFSSQDRSTNVRRIGYVASEIVKHNGIVIVANIAPFQEDRDYNRNIISEYGKYVEIYVNTSLSICESRDVKGLYKKAREGVIKEFTGISSPFEEPLNSEIVLNEENDIHESLDIIFNYLKI